MVEKRVFLVSKRLYKGSHSVKCVFAKNLSISWKPPFCWHGNRKVFFEEKAYEERAWTFCKADVPDKNKPGLFVSLLSSPLPAWGQFADEEGWKPRLPSPLE